MPWVPSTTQTHLASPSLTGYYFEIPSIGAIRINTQVRTPSTQPLASWAQW